MPPTRPPLPPAATSTSTVRRRLWKGAKPIPLVICLAVGLIIRFAIPKPHKLTHGAWTLLAIFITTVLGLVLNPLPVSAWSLLCLTICLVTKALAFAAAFSAFTNEVIWLIVFAYFFSKGFVKTGLGDRIAMVFVRLLGKNTLGLSYGLVLGELVISPGMPSSTARAGGIFLPLIKALALGVESRPKDQSSRRLGAFLIQSQNQCCNNTSALFLTAAAQNLLCLKLAESGGVNIPDRWVVWLKASCLPSIVGLLSTPIILYKIYPPQVKHTPDAPALAKQRLQQMGRIKRDEWVMIATLLLTIALWIASESLHMSSVVTAMIGLSMLLVCGVIDWDDCLSEKQAWDTLIWFGVLIGMATQLAALGVIPWMSDQVGGLLKSMSLSPFGAFGLLQISYFFVHYLFASQTAHVGALYSAFLGMHLASRIPGSLSALALAYNTNLFGAITHYSSGQAAVYYGAGYVELRDVFVLGIVMALINVTIWVLVAAGWWKLLGLY